MGRITYKFEVEQLVRHKTNPNQWLIITKRWFTKEYENMYACSWLTRNGKYREQGFCEYELTTSLTLEIQR